jgi:hypothetical protein
VTKTHSIQVQVPHVICRSIFVRFAKPHQAAMFHRVSDCPGSWAMILGFDTESNMHLLEYVNENGVILKTIRYNANEVVEITQEESVCEAAFGEAV